ncbi:putative Holin of 3TMs, for gene-transfer release [Vibrio phage 282E43-1]|nr:putative Holin of 3TMs, for gene-transfer release [Vibrio phage 282E43-1]
MAVDPITAALNFGSTLLDKFIDDPEAKAAHTLKMAKLAQDGNLAELNAYVTQVAGQLNVNAAEAKHDNIFVAGWRPFIGWVGGGAMAYQFIVYPFLIWLWAIASALGWVPSGAEPPPVLETGALFSIVTGMLGVGGMRSYDKAKGVNTKKVTR